MLLTYIFGRDRAEVHHLVWKFRVDVSLRPGTLPRGVLERPGSILGVAVHRVVMYSRRRCGLCDEAREVLLAERGRLPFDFEEVYIDGDDRLESDYGLRVPVVLVDGAEEFELSVHPGRLRGLLGA